MPTGQRTCHPFWILGSSATLQYKFQKNKGVEKVLLVKISDTGDQLVMSSLIRHKFMATNIRKARWAASFASNRQRRGPSVPSVVWCWRPCPRITVIAGRQLGSGGEWEAWMWQIGQPGRQRIAKISIQKPIKGG